MRGFKLVLILLLILGLPAAIAPRLVLADGVYFDDTSPEFMRLGNNFYEVALRKDNGGIVYITDKTTGQHISEGSLNRCLWVTLVTAEADYDGSCAYPATTYDDANHVESCNYWAGGANRFTYAWLAAERRLELRYTPDPAGPQKVTATVTITASEARWFDMQISLTNGKAVALDIVKFPADLLFIEDDLQEVLLPILPGIVLETGFFDLAPCPPNGDNDRCYEVDYPGPPGVFADYVSLDARQGRFAMYPFPDPGHVAPSHFGLVSHDAWLPGRTYFAHDFKTRVPPGATWTSPRVRMRIGEPRIETINAFRTDTGIAGFDSLRAKLGRLTIRSCGSHSTRPTPITWGFRFRPMATSWRECPIPGSSTLWPTSRRSSTRTTRTSCRRIRAGARPQRWRPCSGRRRRWATGSCHTSTPPGGMMSRPPCAPYLHP